jgi:hypothetical protein
VRLSHVRSGKVRFVQVMSRLFSWIRLGHVTSC